LSGLARVARKEAVMHARSLVPVVVASILAGCGGGGDGGLGVGPTPCSTALATPRAFEGLTFNSPVAMKQAPNDASRWFVVEQGGVIRAFENDPAVTTSEVFIDLSGRVHASGEAGLLGMAFHPDFAMNGRVYLNFSELAGGLVRSVTAEFTSQNGGQTLDPASERVLLSVDKPAAHHNGGDIAFGPDRFLYVGLGDGGAGESAQDPRSLLGKMLRIDVDTEVSGAPYGIPADNPFAGNPPCDADGTGAAGCPEIYARGFRNPWRWSFDRQNGELWVADVGESDWEEIDLVALGGNYGWNVREGAHCFNPPTGCSTAGLTDPVAEYGHDVGSSVTGGYVYRGGQDTEHAGRYVFGDFGGMVASLAPAAAGFTVQQLVERGCTPQGASGNLQISAFAEDLDGELYLLDFGRGEILQLDFAG
jgi:glucose/arabinose dehydrogenase